MGDARATRRVQDDAVPAGPEGDPRQVMDIGEPSRQTVPGAVKVRQPERSVIRAV